MKTMAITPCTSVPEMSGPPDVRISLSTVCWTMIGMATLSAVPKNAKASVSPRPFRTDGMVRRRPRALLVVSWSAIAGLRS